MIRFGPVAAKIPLGVIVDIESVLIRGPEKPAPQPTHPVGCNALWHCTTPQKRHEE